MKNLASTCSNLSVIAIKYYATELPAEVDTSLEGLVKLFEEFPSRLVKSDPEGFPLKVTLILNTRATLYMRAFNLYLSITSLRLS